MGWPSTCTVQAPQRPAPQPNFVPGRPRVSRRTQSSGVSGSASPSTALPLIFSANIAVRLHDRVTRDGNYITISGESQSASGGLYKNRRTPAKAEKGGAGLRLRGLVAPGASGIGTSPVGENVPKVSYFLSNRLR